MGVKQLWALLDENGVVRRLGGASREEHRRLVAEVDGQVLAVDLAAWVMHAVEQRALAELFTDEERCVKVAFERSLQWLRHGVLPVIVVEGKPPGEKQEVQRQRHAFRFGGDGSGGGCGAAQFTERGRRVASVLEQLGLPVFHAPGEAEATCAALAAAGAVHGAVTADSDALLHGAERVYGSLRLSAQQAEQCELKWVDLADVRRRLGIAAGGSAALCALGLLAGSDYNAAGARGVGSVGALAVVQSLLRGQRDDSRALDRLDARLAAPPDRALLAQDRCTGCGACGHEGGRRGRIKAHTAANPCPACPPGQGCGPRAFRPDQCRCAFHARAADRAVERALCTARQQPAFRAEARRAAAVLRGQRQEADAYVAARLAELRVPAGQKLAWRHRPSVSGVHGALQRLGALAARGWDQASLRRKMLPALLEWDLAQGPGGAGTEFRPAAVAKVHGARGGGLAEPHHWRYVLRWQRLPGADLEGLGALRVFEGQEGAGGAAPQAPATPSRRTPLSLPVEEFDRRWLARKEGAESRAVRMSAVRRSWPALEAEWRARAGAAARPNAAARPKPAAKPRATKAVAKAKHAAAASEVAATGGGIARYMRAAAAVPDKAAAPPAVRPRGLQVQRQGCGAVPATPSRAGAGGPSMEAPQSPAGAPVPPARHDASPGKRPGSGVPAAPSPEKRHRAPGTAARFPSDCQGTEGGGLCTLLSSPEGATPAPRGAAPRAAHLACAGAAHGSPSTALAPPRSGREPGDKVVDLVTPSEGRPEAPEAGRLLRWERPSSSAGQPAGGAKGEAEIVDLSCCSG